MSQTFAEVVEDVKQLSSSEKEELQELLRQYLIEERRSEILENAKTGMEEMGRSELKSFSNVDELMDSLSHD
jgi:phosphopantothenate synthetase